MLGWISNLEHKIVFWSGVKWSVGQLVNNDLRDVVIGCQLNLELDWGWIVFGFAQVMLTFSASLGAFDHQVLVSWKNIIATLWLDIYLSQTLFKRRNLGQINLKNKYVVLNTRWLLRNDPRFHKKKSKKKFQNKISKQKNFKTKISKQNFNFFSKNKKTFMPKLLRM
jgi:hypothetical protein